MMAAGETAGAIAETAEGRRPPVDALPLRNLWGHALCGWGHAPRRRRAIHYVHVGRDSIPQPQVVREADALAGVRDPPVA